jgi:hypothetical protein
LSLLDYSTLALQDPSSTWQPLRQKILHLPSIKGSLSPWRKPEREGGLLKRFRALTRRFEICNHGFNINALSRKQAIQGCAGFLQRGNISIGLAVGRDEVANGLTMPCHSNWRAGRNEFGHASAKFPNTYFGSFHLFSFTAQAIL